MMQTEMVLRKPWLKMDINQFKKNQLRRGVKK